MTGAFVLRVARLEVAGVVGREENDGFLVYSEALERIHDATERFVETFDHAQITAEVLPRAASKGLKVGWYPLACVAFAIAVWGRVVVYMVLVMRLEVGSEEEKWFVFFAFLVDVADNRIGHSIHAIPWKMDHFVVVVPEVAIVGVRLEFE